MQYLYNSKEIKEKVVHILSGDGERYAIVAFVGNDAVQYVGGNPADLKVICWPKAGATSADGIRRLMKLGVKVSFCDNLHHKVYWSKNNGVLVGSANLSFTALSSGRQHESAIYLYENSFDIKQILSNLSLRDVSERELYELDLAGENARRSGYDFPDFVGSKKPPTFLEAMSLPFARKWKIVSWSRKWLENEEKEINNEISNNFGVTNHVNSNGINENSFNVGDYALQVGINDNDDKVISRSNGKWLVVDHVIWRSDIKAVVQIKRKSSSLAPPFEPDPAFKRALKGTINDAGSFEDIHDRYGYPTSDFIDSMIKRLT